jgi:mono/diheme cytochrome c family protein
MYNGPDGALYVLDMHHGLIQHSDYLTKYLRQAYEARNLKAYQRTGRIYRIVPDGVKAVARPRLGSAKSPELIEQLSHPNGWWRDTAQRLLVERNDFHTAPALKKLATTGKNALGRLHALWTLEGIRQLDRATLTAALKDPEPKVRAQAIRLSETMLYSPRRTEILPAVLKLADDKDPSVRLQFALTMSGMGMPEGDATLVSLLHDGAGNVAIKDAVISGMRGRELEFLERLLASPAWAKQSGPAFDVLGALARCVITEANPKRVGRLLDVIAAQGPAVSWRQLALIEGFPRQPTTRAARPPRPILLDAEPTAFLGLSSSGDSELESRMTEALAVIHWPGQPGYVPPPPPPPLSPEEQKRFETGKAVYSRTCIQCHKVDGLGQTGLAPPLVDSEWVLGDAGHIIRIVLHGITGPVTVNGQTFNYEMPGLQILNDDEVAAVLTYVRREWDHDASPVTAEQVKKIRSANPRARAWTESSC